MESLREIHIEACPNLESLKGVPPNLSQYAGFTYCPKLTSLSGVEKLAELEQLDVTGCENLVEVGAIGELKALVQLIMIKCRRVTELPPIGELENLVVVMLGGSGVVPASVEAFDGANEDMFFDFTVAE